MSGIGELNSNIQWTCDNCFTKFKSFRSLHLRRNRHCFPNQLSKRRLPKKSVHLENLDQEVPAEEESKNHKNKRNELSSVSNNDFSNNDIQSSSFEYEQSHDNGNLDYEDEENNDHEMDNSSPVGVGAAALYGENSNSILVNNKYIAFQRKFQSLIKNPNVNNEESFSNG